MPLIETKGAASAQGFGEFSGPSGPVNYIEDVFSTYLYTGNGSTQTITNGIDLSTKGGMVWIKDRSSGQNHALSDTARGAGTFKQLQSNTTIAGTTDTFTGFTSSGFTLDASFGIGAQNLNTVTYASWTFREQPKFFDVVTFTPNTSINPAPISISHSLGAVPGAIIIKNASSTGDWGVWHIAFSSGNSVKLNSTEAQSTFNVLGGSPTSTAFLPSGNFWTNGNTYVAYLFAHNAGGFGLSGSDNVISCGSYTGAGASAVNVNLGYEPQWLLWKRTDSTSQWILMDVMRGMTASGDDQILYPNLSNAEASTTAISPTATGFTVAASNSVYNVSGATYIYIAIRRGPMKVPTSGTSVFLPVAITVVANSSQAISFPADLTIGRWRQSTGNGFWVEDRLRGYANTDTYPSTNYRLQTTTTDAETQNSNPLVFNVWNNTYRYGSMLSTVDDIFYSLRRAPGFFDEVCWTGNGSLAFVPHNLGVAPQLIIYKSRTAAGNWLVGADGLTSQTYFLILNSADAQTSSVTGWVSWSSSLLVVDSAYNVSSRGYVAYLFATCPGVSKVGSYTGTGTTKQIDCGFTGGARFVLIKRTDSTGDWYVWDSARGIVAGNDPYLLLNSTAAEVTNTDYVDTYSAGFEISSTAPAAINANGGTFIFLAIA